MMNYFGRVKEQIGTEDMMISFILLCASFNDLLRIPYTSVSFYRLLIPVSLWFIFKYRSILKKEFCVLGLMVLAIISQELLYAYYFFPSYLVPLSHIGKYSLLYFSIWCIFPLVHILYHKHSGMPSFFGKGLWYYALGLVILYVLAVYHVPDLLMNRNNYACCIVVLFPWLILNGLFLGKKIYIPVAVVLLLEIFWGDSKAAIMGIFIQLVLLVIIEVSKRFRHGKWILLVLLSLMGVACVAVLWNMDVMLVTYKAENIGEMFRVMVSHIYYGDPFFSSSDTDLRLDSLRYRTNSTIYILDNIKYSFPWGIGPGNTGHILAVVMPAMAAHWKSFLYISPHNGLLAFISDSGWFAVLLLYPLIKYIFSNMINVHGISYKREYGLLVLTSFFMWNISPSELFTIYFIFIMCAVIFYNEEYDPK